MFKPEPLQQHCMTVLAQICQTNNYLSQVLKNMQNAVGLLRRKEHLRKVVLRNITAFEKNRIPQDTGKWGVNAMFTNNSPIW